MSETWTVTMPKLGETVTEGTVGSWLKQVGDTVAFDDPLFEVSTDKVDSEIPSPYDGVILEILVPAGETVPVGAPLVRIGEPGSTPGLRRPTAVRPRPRRRRAAPRRRPRRAAPRRAGVGPGRRPRPPARCTTSPCPSSARPSPRARSAPGSSTSATPSRSTTRCSRCRRTRSTRRSPARTTACCWRSSCSRARRSRSAPRSPASASRARPRRPAGERPRPRPRRRPRLRPAAPAATPPRPRPTAAAAARRSRRWCGGWRRRTTWTWRRSRARGVGGRIRREDVEKAIAGGGAAAAAPAAPAAAPAAAAPATTQPRPAAPRGRRGAEGRRRPARPGAAALPDAAGARQRAQGLADARGQRVDLHRGRLRQRRQGAGQAQGPVQEGDRLLAVVPALRLAGGGRRAAGVPDGQLLDRRRGQDHDAAPVRQPRDRGRPRTSRASSCRW